MATSVSAAQMRPGRGAPGIRIEGLNNLRAIVSVCMVAPAVLITAGAAIGLGALVSMSSWDQL